MHIDLQMKLLEMKMSDSFNASGQKELHVVKMGEFKLKMTSSTTIYGTLVQCISTDIVHSIFDNTVSTIKASMKLTTTINCSASLKS